MKDFKKYSVCLNSKGITNHHKVINMYKVGNKRLGIEITHSPNTILNNVLLKGVKDNGSSVYALPFAFCLPDSTYHEPIDDFNGKLTKTDRNNLEDIIKGNKVIVFQ